MEQSARVIVALLVLMLSPALVAEQRPAVSESEALRLFLEESPHARKVPLASREVEAEMRGRSLLANPEIGYAIEDAGGVRDEFLTFQQEIPITGRRHILLESAEAAARSARLGAESELAAATHSLRTAFFEVIYREKSVALLREGAARIQRAVEILAAREREGESAGYDRLRAEQELAEVRLTLSEAEVALATARARFGAYFEPSRAMSSAPLRGELDPETDLPDESLALEEALLRRGDLASLRASSEHWQHEARAASRSKYPEPTISAGWKRTEALDVSDTGFVASLVVARPVFDRGQLESARARASRQRTELDLEALERQVRFEVGATLAKERAARAALERHGREVIARSAQLRQIAELAYEEGESGILDLLDAYRVSLATEMRALALRHEAKRAEINRDRALGAEVTR